MFKGTSNRSAEDIARQVDSIGGNMDAFTGKETICFNIKVLDEHLPIAVDVLSDMVLHPVFDGKEIIRERGVILEEIKMDEDNPDYLVHEIFTQNFFKDHPLGKPILGTKETVRRFDQEAILDVLRRQVRARKHDHLGGREIWTITSLSSCCASASSSCRPAPTAGTTRRRRRIRASSCGTRNRWSRCRSALACRRTPSATNGVM